MFVHGLGAVYAGRALHFVFRGCISTLSIFQVNKLAVKSLRFGNRRQPQHPQEEKESDFRSNRSISRETFLFVMCLQKLPKGEK